MSMSLRTIILLILCGIIGVLRFTLPVSGLKQEDLFKDLAHVFVGILFGIAIVSKTRESWAMAVGLTILEVVAAFSR